jgi:hypothetical protein
MVSMYFKTFGRVLVYLLASVLFGFVGMWLFAGIGILTLGWFIRLESIHLLWWSYVLCSGLVFLNLLANGWEGMR